MEMGRGGPGGEERDMARGGEPRLALLQSLQLQVSLPPLPPPHTSPMHRGPLREVVRQLPSPCRSPGGAETRLTPV